VPPDPSASRAGPLRWATPRSEGSSSRRLGKASASPRSRDRNPRAPPELGPRRHEPDASSSRIARALRPILEQIAAYARGDRKRFDVHLDLRERRSSARSGRSNGGSLTERREPTRRWRGRSGARAVRAVGGANGRIPCRCSCPATASCAGRLGRLHRRSAPQTAAPRPRRGGAHRLRTSFFSHPLGFFSQPLGLSRVGSCVEERCESRIRELGWLGVVELCSV